jgi:amidohydrolase
MVVHFSRSLKFFILLLLCASGALGEVDKTTAYLIDEEITRHIQEIIKLRRFLHMNPELSQREFETSKGMTIALRADMDALPIQEDTAVPFQSLNPGVMHACGHDIHTAVALGTALVLSRLRDRIKGNIKFIFQPAEEGPPPGEEGGASLMIREGALDDPPVRAIIALHVWPDIPVGQALFTVGSALAAADGFEITVKGRGAHGARPYEGIDAIVLASQLVLAIHTTLSRTNHPEDPAVVSIGRIQGGIRSNIIADEVRLSGTVRTLSDANRTRIERLLRDIARGVTQPQGADFALQYTRGTSLVYNHPDLADILFPSLQAALGKNNVSLHPPQMVAEDFSEFSQRIPGFYFLLGVRPRGARTMPPLHNSRFLPDEKSIAVGIKAASHLLLDGLAYQHRIED